MTVVFDYLVFNVQFVFAVSQQLIHYIIHFVVCQELFSTFFEILFLKLFGSDRQQLLYLITDLSACQELF